MRWQSVIIMPMHAEPKQKWLAFSCCFMLNIYIQTWHPHTHTHTNTDTPSPHRPLLLRYTFLTLSPPVARQHVPCADTHLPSGFSALNLVLIANWVGEQADAGWMRSRQPRLRLRPLRQWQRQSEEKQQALDIHKGTHASRWLDGEKRKCFRTLWSVFYFTTKLVLKMSKYSQVRPPDSFLPNHGH